MSTPSAGYVGMLLSDVPGIPLTEGDKSAPIKELLASLLRPAAWQRRAKHDVRGEVASKTPEGVHQGGGGKAAGGSVCLAPKGQQKRFFYSQFIYNLLRF